MKILVITPKIPWPASGADEQDRVEGIRLMQELGHEVMVIAKVADFQKGRSDEMSTALSIPVVSVPYTKGGFAWRRFSDLRWLDGAAYEYTDPAIRRAVDDALASFKPDVVWIDASFSWPLIALFKKRGIRTIVRSLQIESTHVLVDEGYRIPNLIRAIGKHLGEMTLARSADAIVAINKNEEAAYRRMGARVTTTMALRSLPAILEDAPIEYRDTVPLHVLFSGSTFSVAHNRVGVMKVIRQIAPALEAAAPGMFMIHITGGKLPADITASLPANVRYEGYVADYTAFMKGMDIAITPDLGRVGMHQKLYEPVARGVPTVTEPWALAGFPLESGVLLARTSREFVTQLVSLRDVSVRRTLGERGRTIALRLFSRECMRAELAAILAS